MRIKALNDLLLLNFIVGLLVIVVIIAPSNALRLVLGLPFLLFFPGYALVASLFPGKDHLDGVERVALSAVLSLVIVPLGGFILNFTPWGVRLYPVLVLITVFILVTSLVAGYRRHRLPEGEKFIVAWHLTMIPWRGKSPVDRVLAAVLALVVLGTIGVSIYAVAVPRPGEKYTEFYLLGPEGKIGGYPVALTLGDEAKVTVVIVNHEQEEMSYRVAVTIDGVSNNTVGPLRLPPGGSWEGLVGFTPSEPGDQTVEFLLYREGQGGIYQNPLSLPVSVAEHE